MIREEVIYRSIKYLIEKMKYTQGQNSKEDKTDDNGMKASIENTIEFFNSLSFD